MSVDQQTEIVSVSEVNLQRITGELRAGLDMLLKSPDRNVKAIADMMARDVDLLSQITAIALNELKNTYMEGMTDVDEAFQAGVEYGSAKTLVDAKPADLVSNVNGRLSELVHNFVVQSTLDGTLTDGQRQALYQTLSSAISGNKHVLSLIGGKR